MIFGDGVLIMHCSLDISLDSYHVLDSVLRLAGRLGCSQYLDLVRVSGLDMDVLQGLDAGSKP